MKLSVSSCSEVRLFLTVLLSNRCMAEAWGLLQQHTTKINVEELLKDMYDICREMGLVEDFLKLPFTDAEQVLKIHSESEEIARVERCHFYQTWYFTVEGCLALLLMAAQGLKVQRN
ncbi:protein ELYS-like [Phalacrocorax aristotelis]|uniref:protein ELYS-like n=1 Tax=Phalacrocorax aristotelis TaxID=126867 RepID=UPI003F4C0A54